MAKKNKTIVNFILDHSGSMQSVREATISGFNEYLQTLKEDTKNVYEFSLTLFDTETNQVTTSLPLKEVKDLSSAIYNPSGMTALYDAVCKTIAKIKPAKGDKVLTIIMTDGEENSSKEYTQVEMKKMIEEREKEGNWTFVYLGANQDSYAVAQKYGISQGNTVNFHATSKGMAGTMRTVATSNVMYASASGGAGGSSAFFTTTAKDDIENTK